MSRDIPLAAKALVVVALDEVAQQFAGEDGACSPFCLLKNAGSTLPVSIPGTTAEELTEQLGKVQQLAERTGATIVVFAAHILAMVRKGPRDRGRVLEAVVVFVNWYGPDDEIEVAGLSAPTSRGADGKLVIDQPVPSLLHATAATSPMLTRLLPERRGRVLH